MATNITLKNGIELELSSRQGNTSGYTGATVSPAWTLDTAMPFIAMTQNPSDPILKRELTAKFRRSLHLGHYSDAREAAYVIGMYNKDPLDTIRKFNQYGKFKVFPRDLYDQPIGLSLPKAQAMINMARTSSSMADIPAKNNLLTYFNRADIVQLANDIGGAEPFQEYIADMSLQDFIDDFQLELK